MVSGHSKSIGISQIDGLPTGPLNLGHHVTPRPKRVHGIGNRRVAYVHQGLP